MEPNLVNAMVKDMIAVLFDLNFAAIYLIPKTSGRIAWHRPFDMPTDEKLAWY